MFERLELLDDECRCECHRSGPFKKVHMAACCSVCQFCDKRVVGSRAMHEAQCAKNPTNSIRKVMQKRRP